MFEQIYYVSFSIWTASNEYRIIGYLFCDNAICICNLYEFKGVYPLGQWSKLFPPTSAKFYISEFGTQISKFFENFHFSWIVIIFDILKVLPQDYFFCWLHVLRQPLSYLFKKIFNSPQGLRIKWQC